MRSERMNKIALNVDDLAVETFPTLEKEAWSETQLGYLTELETCSCIDCRTATAGRCCPP
jgi:hypothetical protein